jgi:hypothetical protein
MYGPQIVNPQIATFAEGLQIKRNLKIADLRFAEQICFGKYK